MTLQSFKLKTCLLAAAILLAAGCSDGGSGGANHTGGGNHAGDIHGGGSGGTLGGGGDGGTPGGGGDSSVLSACGNVPYHPKEALGLDLVERGRWAADQDLGNAFQGDIGGEDLSQLNGKHFLYAEDFLSNPVVRSFEVKANTVTVTQRTYQVKFPLPEPVLMTKEHQARLNRQLTVYDIIYNNIDTSKERKQELKDLNKQIADWEKEYVRLEKEYQAARYWEPCRISSVEYKKNGRNMVEYLPYQLNKNAVHFEAYKLLDVSQDSNGKNVATFAAFQVSGYKSVGKSQVVKFNAIEISASDIGKIEGALKKRIEQRQNEVMSADNLYVRQSDTTIIKNARALNESTMESGENVNFLWDQELTTPNTSKLECTDYFADAKKIGRLSLAPDVPQNQIGGAVLGAIGMTVDVFYSPSQNEICQVIDYASAAKTVAEVQALDNKGHTVTANDVFYGSQSGSEQRHHFVKNTIKP